MGADDRTDMAYENILHRKARCDHGAQLFRILRAVAVTDKNRLVFRRQDGFGHMIQQSGNGSAPASGLGNRNKVPLLIYVQDRFNAKHSAKECGGSGYPSASF